MLDFIKNGPIMLFELIWLINKEGKMKKIVLSLLMGFITSTIFAATSQPAKPTINDVSNYNACVDYGKNMVAYLKALKSSNFEDIINQAWFTGIGDFTNPDQSGSINTINYYDAADASGKLKGIAHLCTVLKSPFNQSQNIKSSLLPILTQAYKLAIAHKNIISSEQYAGYGIYGPASSCSINGNISGCKLINQFVTPNI